jgi:hypothetical protein
MRERMAVAGYYGLKTSTLIAADLNMRGQLSRASAGMGFITMGRFNGNQNSKRDIRSP